LLPVELASARLDLLHATDVVVPRGWRGPAVATVHDVAFLRHPEFLTDDSRRYYEGVHRTVSRADLVIVVSEHTRAELEELTAVDPTRVRVIPNAIPERFFAAGSEDGASEVLRRNGLARPLVLFVSTIEPRKNVVTLLHAVRHMRDAGCDVQLALVGADGWRSDDVYETARDLRLGDRARFLGYVPPDDLAALYRAADVLAHPAIDEGFGMTPLEAMAAGTPAVVADVSGLREAVGDAAIRVPPRDDAAWADALMSLLADADAARGLAEDGRRRAAGFSVLRMARATLAVYREVLGAGSGP
jgi:glycosyltransferase involved in cell wall biosynthesis